MENFESSSLSRLNDGDKAELQKFLANEQQRSSIQTGELSRDRRDKANSISRWRTSANRVSTF